ncbi:hypothetical protein EDB87DRAFT_1424980 [Lactarius vividus]|nr:hypothetical protein EDB87DRAFT_1424980 [Lactarius vividus]
MDVLEREPRTGRGWIACTTDAVFLEKPQYYGLVIDLTRASAERRATARRAYGSLPRSRTRAGRHITSPPLASPGVKTMDRARSYTTRWRHERRRARIVHRPRCGRGRTRGACTRTCVLSA